jgi:hypothetical protein
MVTLLLKPPKIEIIDTDEAFDEGDDTRKIKNIISKSYYANNIIQIITLYHIYS